MVSLRFHEGRKACFLVLCLFYGLLFLPSCSKDGDEDVLPPDSGIQDGSGESQENEEGSHSQPGKDLLLGTWGLIHSVSDEWKTVITFNEDGTYTASDYYIDMNGEYTEFEGTSEGRYDFDGVSLSIKLGSGEGTVLTGDYEVLVLTQSELRIKSENYEAHGTKESGTGEGGEDGNRGPVSEAFMGNGTKTDPYLIMTAADLRKLSDDVRNGTSFRGVFFRMENDIVINRNVLTSAGNLNGSGNNFEQWIPIGAEKTPFSGSFDGNGYSIKGIYIDADEDDSNIWGLFGCCTGSISNLDLKDSFIRGRGNIGGIVGGKYEILGDMKDDYSPKLFHCRNYATIEAIGKTSYIGGCVGRCSYAMIDHCANYGILLSDNDNSTVGGGIAGATNGTLVLNCYNEGDINTVRGGGIAGFLSEDGRMENCFNNGCIETKTAGGLCVLASINSSIVNCVNYGEVFGRGVGDAICPNVQSTDLSFVYYLEASVTTDSEDGISMTAKQMKGTSFLKTLNSNAKNLGSDYDRWITGKDGFPVLEWSEEL